MADNGTKKRKRQPDGDAALQNKMALQRTIAEKDSVIVELDDVNGPFPALVSSSGFSSPGVRFAPFSKPRKGHKSTGNARPSSHDLLLYSSQHPRLDYTATPSPFDEHLSHYVAVFDPSRNHLRLIPAHFLNLRSALRAEPKPAPTKLSAWQLRNQLGQEFGTKKAKKAIASKTENAILQDAKGGDRDVQSAILDSVAVATASTPRKEDLASDTLASKPIPQPNLSAESVEDVYPFDALLPPGDARLVPIKDWQAKTRAKEDIQLRHRLPAARVQAIGESGDMNKLKALRYLTLLLDFHDALQNAGRDGKKVPKKEILNNKLSTWPEDLVTSVRHRFANAANELPKWYMDNLYTHLCALTLYVDGWATPITELRDDLKLEGKRVSQYFVELGCKVTAPTEKERERMGWTKAQAGAVRMARLKVPLELPKPRAGRRR